MVYILIMITVFQAANVEAIVGTYQTRQYCENAAELMRKGNANRGFGCIATPVPPPQANRSR